VLHYQREGSFGYLHHEARTQDTDALIVRLAHEAGYTADETAGLLVSRQGALARGRADVPRRGRSAPAA